MKIFDHRKLELYIMCLTLSKNQLYVFIAVVTGILVPILLPQVIATLNNDPCTGQPEPVLFSGQHFVDLKSQLRHGAHQLGS